MEGIPTQYYVSLRHAYTHANTVTGMPIHIMITPYTNGGHLKHTHTCSIMCKIQVDALT